MRKKHAPLRRDSIFRRLDRLNSSHTKSLGGQAGAHSTLNP